MSKLKLTGKQLRAIGYPEGPVISTAMNTMEKNFKHLSHADAMEILSSVLQSPNEYANDPVLSKIAEGLLPTPESSSTYSVASILRKGPCTRCIRPPNYRWLWPEH